MSDENDDGLGLEDTAPASDRTVKKSDNKSSSRGDDDLTTGDQLKSIVQRIERLEEEKKTIADDIKEVYSEAKANGYDTKVLRKLISIRRRNQDEVKEEEAILDLYLQAVGYA